MENGNIEFTLSLENINKIPFHKYDKDFTFIVNGKRYETNRIIADILSPTIRKSHFIDSSVNEFLITNPYIQFGEEDYFEDFLNLANYQNSKIDQIHQKRFSEYFYFLGNLKEFFQVQPFYYRKITVDTVVDLLISTSKIAVSLNQWDNPIESMISYAASNFEYIDKEKMKELEIEILKKILSSEKLKLNDEDSLLKFLLSLYDVNHSNSELFEYIIFSNISQESFHLFISKFDVEDINSNIWNSICSRLFTQNSKNDQKALNSRYLYEIKEFKHETGKDFRGIMYYLQNETKGNIHDNGTIEITSNSIRDKCHPKNLVDFNKTNNYDSNDDGNAIICFDFKNRLVQLSGYSIRSNDNGPNGCHLKNWVIEVSKNGIEWKEIDSHINDPCLNGPNITSTFVIQNDDDFHRFVRLRQTGNSWYQFCNHNRFWILFMEFYGKIKEQSE